MNRKNLLFTKQWAPVLFLTIAIAFISYALHLRQGTSDPDYYYHLAIARLSAENGLLRTLPQAIGIGWNHYFPDKEFLFHRALSLAYRSGGVNFVDLTPPLCAAFIFALLTVFCGTFLNPAIAGLLCFGMLALNQSFVWRLSLLRPQIFAILFFCTLLIGLLKKNKPLVVAACLGFVLSYHAIYLLFLPLLFSPLLSEAKGAKKYEWLIWGGASISLGIIINPYFPSNLVMLWRHLCIAIFEAGASPDLFGAELVPLTTAQFLKEHLYGLMAFIFALVRFYYFLAGSGSNNAQKLREFIFLIGLSTLYWLAAALNPRSIEYAVPLTTLLLAFSLRDIKLNQVKLAIFICGSWILQTQSIAMLGSKLTEHPTPPTQIFYSQALQTIPSGPKNIFTCDWPDGSRILYARPDLSFTDLLDPSFLREYDPATFFSRQILVKGMNPAPFGAIKKQNADYVFCREKLLVDELERDSNFKRIYPLDATNPADPLGIYIFEVAKKQSDVWVSHYQTKELPNNKNPDFLQLNPANISGANWNNLVASENYFGLKNTNTPTNNLSIWCTAIRPSVEEIKAHQGSTLIGVGGGRNIRLWLNAKPLYYSQHSPEFPRLLHQFIRLKHPLQANDTLEAIVCSQYGLPFYGFALSFWKEPDIAKACEWKEANIQKNPSAILNTDWENLGNGPKNCLAGIAFKK